MKLISVKHEDVEKIIELIKILEYICDEPRYTDKSTIVKIVKILKQNTGKENYVCMDYNDNNDLCYGVWFMGAGYTPPISIELAYKYIYDLILC